ncbi:MAG: hypothetical protein KIT11_04530 [Fimbriimonadaceae bacterium]|nr:hypothetical protein [Fimbriimonadaceae bacterium]QYK56840.1 MAG: hypothetical protein KF733_04995 [Fimbriimonadaceae bacterium]
MRYFALLLSALLILLSGCAKFPSNGSSSFTKRLVFRMAVDGKIRTGATGGLPYIYIIPLRLSEVANPTDDGPIPIVIPGGNGFVTGNATHYILFNPLNSPPYTIYQFADATLETSFPIGVPINYLPGGVDSDTIGFEIDLSQLVGAANVDSINSIQANFLTMNNRNVTGGGRIWDALGDSRNLTEINSYVTFRLDQSRTLTNDNTGRIEPVGDCPDPDLDIRDWSIDVRLNN